MPPKEVPTFFTARQRQCRKCGEAFESQSGTAEWCGKQDCQADKRERRLARQRAGNNRTGWRERRRLLVS